MQSEESFGRSAIKCNREKCNAIRIINMKKCNRAINQKKCNREKCNAIRRIDRKKCNQSEEVQ
jgi:hypothetical protein